VTLAPELRLALACARVALGPGEREEVRACLDAGIDWDRLLRVARWHGLRPLLHRHLAGCEGVPRPVQVELWGEAEAIARANRAMAAELARILALFDSAGIKALPYKGPTLAVRAHGEVALREFGDLDILVPRVQVRRARDMLCAGGYEREYALAPDIEDAYLESGAQYHLVVRAPDGGPVVELHWKTDPDYPAERLDGEGGWEGARAIGALRTFADEDLLLVLCIHGSKHFWSSLGWLADVAEILRSPCEVDWDRFVARSDAMGASRRVGVGLGLAAGLLGAPLARPCRDLAERSDVQKLLPPLREALLAAEPALLPQARAWRLQWAMHGTRLRGIRDLVRAVSQPSLVEWTRWPLPKPLFFAYPGLRMGRLAGKYLGRAFHGVFGGRKLQS
jgi:hypothetical protein